MKLFLKILFGFFALIGLIVAGFWFASAQAGKPGPDAPPLSALTSDGFQTTIDGIVAERKLVGMVAKVMVDGDILVEAASGWRTKEEEAAITASDPIHVGSIGKSMSATTIASLVEDEVMAWDDTLGERLSAVPMDEGWRSVTLHQLLTHTGSAPRPPLSVMINQVSEPVRLAEVRRETAALLLTEPPSTEPGTRYAYSNSGFMLASLMAEEASGQSWETLVQARLATPLGLETLGFGAPQGDAPWGHRRLGPFKLSADPAEPGADNPPWMAAAGTMHVTLDDLLTYGQAHLNAGRSEDAILSEETYARLHTPERNDYAYGWIVESRDFGEGSEQVIWHNGSNTMWYALLMLLPERNAIITLATNDGSQINLTQKRFDQFANEIARMIVSQN